jgi:thiol-disulfide isomerase/thioredoxin
MKPLTLAILLTTLASFSAFAEPPDVRASEAIPHADKPFAVAFNGDGCLMCRALAPASRNLAQKPEFMGITLFVAKFDTEKVLERSLGITEHSTIEVFKDGKESARSTVVTQYDTLSELLQRVIS